MMLWGHSIVFWYFATRFAASICAVLVSLVRMWRQVNTLLPADAKIPAFPPDPESIGQFFLGTQKISYLLTILDEHRNTIHQAPCVPSLASHYSGVLSV
jgi:hypothetical protein